MYPGKWAELTPDKPAAIDSETGAMISFRELDERSNRLVRLFRARGLRPGDHIAIFLENDIRFFEAAWAVLRSGLYLTTVNCYLTVEEAAYIVIDCGARALISSRRLAAVAREIPPRTPNCNILLALDGVEGFEDFDEARYRYSPEPLEQQPRGSFMFYSSGTTGVPKGILHSNGVRTQLCHAFADYGFGPDSVTALSTPLYSNTTIVTLLPTLAHGGTVVLMRHFDAGHQIVGLLLELRVQEDLVVNPVVDRILRDVVGVEIGGQEVAAEAADDDKAQESDDYYYGQEQSQYRTQDR